MTTHHSLEEVRRRLGLDQDAAGPKRVTSLRARSSALAPPAQQLAVLSGLTLEREFEQALMESGWQGLHPAELEILQINLGRLCNMACRHCHVDAGPDRVTENMTRATAELCLQLLDQTQAHTVDLTGGAPELNPNFGYLVEECVARGKHVIDRCNLTVLLLDRFRETPQWLAEHGVEVVCSLPHNRRRNTDAQRGTGTFDRSIEALGRLNEAGYGQGDPKRVLTLMHNPAGAFLPGDQPAMERQWKSTLHAKHGVTFDRLVALNNMPIARFLEWLIETDNLEGYMETLTQAYNPAAIDGLMCRNTLSVSWDGTLYDCDFNQMLDLPVQVEGRRPHLEDYLASAFDGRQVVTHRHCFGCTAGAGSSCGGATA